MHAVVGQVTRRIVTEPDGLRLVIAEIVRRSRATALRHTLLRTVSPSIVGIRKALHDIVRRARRGEAVEFVVTEIEVLIKNSTVDRRDL
jgi:hypothetical protein